MSRRHPVWGVFEIEATRTRCRDDPPSRLRASRGVAQRRRGRSGSGFQSRARRTRGRSRRRGEARGGAVEVRVEASTDRAAGRGEHAYTIGAMMSTPPSGPLEARRRARSDTPVEASASARRRQSQNSRRLLNATPSSSVPLRCPRVCCVSSPTSKFSTGGRSAGPAAPASAARPPQ